MKRCNIEFTEFDTAIMQYVFDESGKWRK